MFCTNCGSRLQNSDMFCGNCGSKVLITEDYVNIENANESYENPISQVASSEDQDLSGNTIIYNSESTVENNNVANTSYVQQSNLGNNSNNTTYGQPNIPVNNSNNYSNNYSNNNSNYQHGNYSNSINTSFINETINSLKTLFINPFDFLNKLPNMSNAVTATIGLLSLILTLFTLNKLYDNLLFSYFLDSGHIIFSLVIYCLGLSTVLYVCSITIANTKVSWFTLLKLSIVVSLISSVGYFLSLIFSSISTEFSIALLVLSSLIGILMTYEGFLRITSTTIKNAKISLITSYCVISFLSYLFIYSNM